MTHVSTRQKQRCFKHKCLLKSRCHQNDSVIRGLFLQHKRKCPRSEVAPHFLITCSLSINGEVLTPSGYTDDPPEKLGRRLPATPAHHSYFQKVRGLVTVARSHNQAKIILNHRMASRGSFLGAGNGQQHMSDVKVNCTMGKSCLKWLRACLNTKHLAQDS